ncbi:flavin reductase family protein [Chloroflexota bacterium]
MDKKTMGPHTWIYLMPALLIGTNVDGKANFMTAAWGGIANSQPPMVSVAIRHKRHTYLGINQNMTFSVNVPSLDILQETDCCGIYSGGKTDKVEDCHFDVFYGKLETAPPIGQCPVNHECQVVQMIDLGSHALVIGRIKETYVSKDCLTNGEPDADKIKPFSFTVGGHSHYRVLREEVGRAFSIGKELYN